jgi:hypothetical protein
LQLSKCLIPLGRCEVNRELEAIEFVHLASARGLW